MRPIEIANLAIAAAFPLAWAAPLARAGVLPFFGTSEISVLSGVATLAESDLALAALVALFVIVAPVAKAALLALILSGRLRARLALDAAEALGRLALTDMFLVAVYIVAVKGVGLGSVETAWGLYFYTALALGAAAVGFVARREIEGAR